MEAAAAGAAAKEGRRGGRGGGRGGGGLPPAAPSAPDLPPPPRGSLLALPRPPFVRARSLTAGTGATSPTSVSSREITDIRGRRVQETTTVTTMPDGTVYRTTETAPIGAGERGGGGGGGDGDGKKGGEGGGRSGKSGTGPGGKEEEEEEEEGVVEEEAAPRITTHERVHPGGGTARTTITANPDGSRVRQVETVWPGGAKSVVIETTDAEGRRSTERAEYPPTLVSPPYGAQSVVSELTFHPHRGEGQAEGEGGGILGMFGIFGAGAGDQGGRRGTRRGRQERAPYGQYGPYGDKDGDEDGDEDDESRATPVGLQERGEAGKIQGVLGLAPPGGRGGAGPKPKAAPAWRTTAALAALVVLGGTAIGAAVGVITSLDGDGGGGEGREGAAANPGGGGGGGGGMEGPPGTLPESTPRSVGYGYHWPSGAGWPVAPQVAGRGRQYYRMYQETNLGQCAARCARTDSVAGAFMPLDGTASRGGGATGDGHRCYCFEAADCLEPGPVAPFTGGGTVFAREAMPPDKCDMSICWYLTDDLLCPVAQSSSVSAITPEPTPRPSLPPTGSPTRAPSPWPTTAEPTGPITPPPSPTPTRAPTAPPTGAPTARPTGSPTVPPTGVPTDHPTDRPTWDVGSAVPTPVPTTGQPTSGPLTSPPSTGCRFRPFGRDIGCGDPRFTPWDYLPPFRQVFAEIKLGYTKETWNRIGTQPLERLSWELLTSDQALGAGALGFNQESWDCYQNHYWAYSWRQLEISGVQIYFVALGFDEQLWKDPNRRISVNGVDDLQWSDLSNGQKSILGELCYNEIAWDGLRLDA